MEGRPKLSPTSMSLFDSTQIGLERAISGAGLRQTTLAQNVANANTPGYVRRDVDFKGTLRSAMRSGESPENVSFSAQVDSGAALRADGNGVDIDAESASLAQNALEYQSLVSVARARVDILVFAMGGA